MPPPNPIRPSRTSSRSLHPRRPQTPAPEPAREVNRCRPTLAADISLNYRSGNNGQEVPAYVGGGLSLDVTGFPDLIPVNVEADLDCQWQPWGSDSTALTFHGDAGYGPHWLQTFTSADRASPTARQGFGFSDFNVGLRVPLNDTFTLVTSVGRQASSMGWQGVPRRLSPYWSWSQSFLVSPFSDSGVSAGVETSRVTLRAAVSAGPDRLPWSDNNQSLWGSFYLKWIPIDELTLSANYQFGRDQDGDNDHWTYIVDLGAAIKTQHLLFGVYGLLGMQETPDRMSGSVHNLMWGAFEAYAHGRFPGSIFGLAGSLGYFTDGVARTGVSRLTARGIMPNTDVATIQGTISLDLHPWEVDLLQRDGTTAPFDRLLFNFHAGVVQCLSASCGFADRELYTVGADAIFQWAE